MKKIKSEHGARVGRYVIASTTAKFDEPDSIFDIPCDMVFTCSQNIDVSWRLWLMHLPPPILAILLSVLISYIDLNLQQSHLHQVTEDTVKKLSTNGCKGLIECIARCVDASGVKTLKKYNMMHGPYRACTAGASLVNGHTIIEKVTPVDI